MIPLPCLTPCNSAGRPWTPWWTRRSARRTSGSASSRPRSSGWTRPAALPTRCSCRSTARVRRCASFSGVGLNLCNVPACCALDLPRSRHTIIVSVSCMFCRERHEQPLWCLCDSDRRVSWLAMRVRQRQAAARHSDGVRAACRCAGSTGAFAAGGGWRRIRVAGAAGGAAAAAAAYAARRAARHAGADR